MILRLCIWLASGLHQHTFALLNRQLKLAIVADFTTIAALLNLDGNLGADTAAAAPIEDA